MSTLADELLQDFEDSGGESEGDAEANGLLFGDGPRPEQNGDVRMGDMDLDSDEDEDEDEEMEGAEEEVEDPEEIKDKVEKMQLRGVDDVRSVAGLMKTLRPVLEKIEHYRAQPMDSEAAMIGNIEDNPEYHLLTQSNSLATQIDSEIMIVHKFIRDHYSVRFPELETLITNPLEYAKVVAILGNGPMDSESMKAIQNSTDNPLGVSLRSVLDGPSLMIVTVEATTTKGTEMTPQQLERVIRACEMVVSLDKAKKTLTEYVQSRMNVFAPNLTALIGSLTAAQLLNAAGGLTGLSKTPACNISAWGAKKMASSTGLATNVGPVRQQGFLYHSPIIRGLPADLRKQGMRIVAAKLVLAARVDRIHSAPDGSTGKQLRDDCLRRLDKLTEPPPNKGRRALPAPDDKPSRKRGGRRVRKAKEATAMTELRREQNRMAFGKEEKEVGFGTGDSTAGLGMIGQLQDGRIRAIQVDSRTRAKLSQKNKGWDAIPSGVGTASSLRAGGAAGGLDLGGKGLRSSGVGTSLGIQSSLAFTPVQGLELVDPKVQAELGRKRKAEEDRWFKSGTFTQVGGGTSGGGGGASTLPPPSKKVDTGAGKMGPPPVPKRV